MTVKEWLKLNWQVGALSFGGGGRAIYYQDALVGKSTELSEDEFQESITVAQLVPGPNLVNLAMYLGIKLVGIAWMIAGFLLLCIPGALLAVVFYRVIDLNDPRIMLVFKGFSLGSVTFFLIFVYRLSKGLRTGIGKHVTSGKFAFRVIAGLAVVFLSLYGVPLSWVLIFGLPLGILFEFQT